MLVHSTVCLVYTMLVYSSCVLLFYFHVYYSVLKTLRFTIHFPNVCLCIPFVGGCYKLMKLCPPKIFKFSVCFQRANITLWKAKWPHLMLFFFQDQYIFIHDAVLESVTCGDTEIKAADLRRKLVKLKTRDQSGLTALDLQFTVSDIFFVRKQQGKGKVNQDSSCFSRKK